MGGSQFEGYVESISQTMEIVIVPNGACEQHGPHLPLEVDTIDCYEVAKRVSAKNRSPSCPTINVWLFTES
jgi:creatinine amidohydrolase